MAKKGKGAAFEREICKAMSLWWTGGESDAVFWRTSQSGGRSTSRGKKGRSTANQSGDVCATDPVGLPFLEVFSLEIKRGYNARCSINDLLDHPQGGMMGEWLAQAEESRKQASALYWMLIVKRDRRDALVFVQREGAIALFRQRKAHAGSSLNSLEVEAKPHCAMAYRLRDFLAVTLPKDVLKARDA
jgi:hypothetical protein